VSTAVEREGRFTGWLLSKIMNQTVLESIVSVRGFPLDVLAGSTEDAVFAPWRSEAWRIALRTLLTSAAMLGLIALAAWGLARREREREEMQRQLQQAAKMEAIGRLAGGSRTTSTTFWGRSWATGSWRRRTWWKAARCAGTSIR